MKHLRRALSLVVILTLCLGALSAQAAPYYGADYSNLIGAMEIVNCQSWTSLRARPDSFSTRLDKVPVGAVVYNCCYYDDKYTYCVYDGIEGYILNSNLSFIYGPVGYAYPEESYLGNMQIVNCQSYAVLRDYPNTRAGQVARVPLGDIVTNVFAHDDRFCYCMYGNLEGYILIDNLEYLSGAGSGSTVYAGDWIGDCYIVNCISYASLRELPSTSAYRLAKVPYGSLVTDCYYVDDRFACCTWNGMVGYILLDNLGW